MEGWIGARRRPRPFFVAGRFSWRAARHVADGARGPIWGGMERPCIKVCEFDEVSGWCLGCGMTRPERKAWKKVPNYRVAILDSLPGRLAAMAAEGHRVGEDAKRKKKD